MTEPDRSDALPRQTLLLTATALALGLMVDLSFRRQAIGLSFPLWSALSVAALYLAARWEGIRPRPAGGVLSAALLALSAGAALRLEPLTVALSVLGTLLLFALMLRTFVDNRLLRFGWLDFVFTAVSVPLETLLRPWGTFADAIGQVAGDRTTRSRGFAVLRGALLALPVIAVFVVLLASADLVFEAFVEDALAWLDFEWMRELVSHAAFIGIGGLVSLGALVTALRRRKPRPLIGEQEPLMPRFIGFTEAVVVLAAVDLVFLIFVVIQFRYLFGGEANLTQAGYTYADYARRGFGEMVWAAILGQGLILGLGQWSRSEGRRQLATLNALSAGLVAMLLVTLLSALTRLLLYEEAYGFTRSRSYGHLFILWLAAALVALIVLLYRSRIRLYAPACAVAATGFGLSLSAINVDGFIAERNMDRYEATGDLDVRYLAQLTADAIPELAGRADSNSPPELLALLACRGAMLQAQLESASWQSYNLGRQRARRALADIRPVLRPYEVTAESMRWKVEGPGVELDYCGGVWLD